MSRHRAALFAWLLFALVWTPAVARAAEPGRAEPLRESVAGPLLAYGESPAGDVTQGRLGLWVFAHGAASTLAISRARHPALGTVTTLDVEMQITLPLWRVFPVGGLGVKLGSAGGTDGAIPVVGALAPSLGVVWTPAPWLWLALQARYQFWSTGREHDTALVSLEVVAPVW